MVITPKPHSSRSGAFFAQKGAQMTTKYEKMFDDFAKKNDKVAKRRKAKMDKAIAEGDWDELLRLFDQVDENYSRKLRYHGQLSLNFPVGTFGYHAEMMDFVNDNSYRPDFELDKSMVWEAFETLPEVEQTIIIERVIKNQSYIKIGKLVGMSDKTVKKHLLKSLKTLSVLLEDFDLKL